MRGLILLMCIGSVSVCHADPLFESDERLDVRIEAPLQQLARDRAEEPEERPGWFGYTDDTGTAQRLEIKVQPRGKSRRDRDVCQFPPLWLNFKKGDVKDTLLDKQNKLKLVTHCASLGSKSDRAVDDLWLEYLAYRIFNQITDQSFRVRPLAISYLDTQTEREYQQPGFLIEHKRRLSHRLEASVFEHNSIHPRELNEAASQLVEFLQYMLGNTDFSLVRGPEGDACCHNMVLMGETPEFLPVPYDFDITGFVNRRGSLPAEGLGIDRVTQRVYRGFCREPDIFQQGIARYVEEREAIMALVEGHAWMTNGGKSKALKFLRRFYDTIEKPKNLERQIVSKCR